MPRSQEWKTIIIRHKRENLKKCSLQPLVGRDDLSFITFPFASPLELKPQSIVLSMEGPLLSQEDQGSDIILLDATWQLAAAMEKSLNPRLMEMKKRSLPSHYRTAYPRRQTGCIDPLRGLASVEALYIAFILLGRNPEGLLDHYHWREEFLAHNRFLG